MKLIKKIIILVNLILCMLCINSFASVNVNYVFNEQLYEYTENIDESYKYWIVLNMETSSAKIAVFYYSKNPIVVKYYNSTDKDIFSTTRGEKYYCYETINYYSNSSLMPYLGGGSISYSSSGSAGNFGSTSKFTLIGSSHDIYNQDTGELAYSVNDIYDGYINPPFDDTTIDWEDAFEYYIVPYDNEDCIEHMGDTYDRNLTLITKANNIDGLLSNEELHNNNIYYWLHYDIDFVFTDSSGEQHTRTLHNIQAFDDKFYSFDFPYLISEMGDDEQYNLFLVAWESYIAVWDNIPWPGPQGSEIWGFDNTGTNAIAFYNDIVEHFVDEYGYFDYDLILKPYVTKQITYPEYVEEVIYYYDEVSLIYDVNNPNYILPDNLPDSTSPDGFENIELIVSPDGDIIGGIDNSDDYDFDDNYNIIDKDGNVVATPEIDKDNKTTNWTGPNGENLGSDGYGDNRPSPEDKVNGTIKDKHYDITGVIRKLKEDLQELVSGDGSLAKMFAWFRQIFEWLPFDILSIFGMIIAFFIIFEFFHIIRK